MFLSYSGFGRREFLLILDRRLKELLGFGKYRGVGSIPAKPRSPLFLITSAQQTKTIWQQHSGMFYLLHWGREKILYHVTAAE